FHLESSSEPPAAPSSEPPQLSCSSPTEAMNRGACRSKKSRLDGRSWPSTTHKRLSELMAQIEPRRPPPPASSHTHLGSTRLGTHHARGTQRRLSKAGSSGLVVNTWPSATKSRL